jgi:hypothetical protein
VSNVHRAERWFLAVVVALLAAVYFIAWWTPGFGLYHDDGVYLSTARSLIAGHGYAIESLPTPIPQTKYPPALPALLALFSLVSSNLQWLKLIPLGCAAAWLWMTRKLLLKMGASNTASLVIAGLTAAAPVVVFLATNLLSEMLFSLLVSAALLFLLEERPVAGGLCAGLAFLTRTAGISLIGACVLILLMRKRLRGAAILTATSVLVASPWLAWQAFHPVQDRYYGGGNYVAENVITGLQASEKVAVMSNNLLFLLASPSALLTNFTSLWTVVATAVLALWCLYKRRQLVPDLFLFLYMLMLDLWAGPPQRFMAPVLPLILWVTWRAVRTIQPREMVVAAVLILSAVTLFSTVRRLPETVRNGQFPSSPQPPSDWSELEKMFAWVRANTPQDAIVMANLDPLWYLETGRKAVRGFVPDNLRTFYTPGATPIAASGMAAELLRTHAGWVAISPDRDFAEAPAYHRAVEALERGGLLEPVEGVGLAPGYRLLRATGVTSLR